MKALHDIQVGARFVGNVCGQGYVVIDIKGKRGNAQMAVVELAGSGRKMLYGLEALKRCDIKIIK